jgi:transcription elongation factor Elf1
MQIDKNVNFNETLHIHISQLPKTLNPKINELSEKFHNETLSLSLKLLKVAFFDLPIKTKPFIAICQICGFKSIIDLDKKHKTKTLTCKNCTQKTTKINRLNNCVEIKPQIIKTKHKIIGEITKESKKGLKIKWY